MIALRDGLDDLDDDTCREVIGRRIVEFAHRTDLCGAVTAALEHLPEFEYDAACEALEDEFGNDAMHDVFDELDGLDGLDGLGDSLFFFLEILTPTWAPPAGRWEKHPPGATKTPAAARKAKDRARRKATKKGKAKKK